MQIQPREYFTIARGLQDPSDSTTYYVQAVVRNARTDVLIDTVNLTDNGSRRFTKAWQAPADVSGDGLYILITISVYTDSAYSVRADNYGDSFDEHLIQARPTPAMLNSAALGGPDIDYEKIQKMINKSLADFDPVKVTTQKVSLGGVEKALSDMATELHQLNQKEVEETNLDPVVQSIAATEKRLIAVISERPEFEKTDLNPLIQLVQNVLANIDDKSKIEELTGILERMRTFFDGDIESIKAEVKSIKEFLDSMPYITLQGGKVKQNE